MEVFISNHPNHTEQVMASWKVSGRDENRSKYQAEIAITAQSLFIFKKQRLYEFRGFDSLSYIIICCSSSKKDFILQFKRQASIRFFSPQRYIFTDSRDDIVRSILVRNSTLNKQKTMVYFLDVINLHRFFTTEEML